MNGASFCIFRVLELKVLNESMHRQSHKMVSQFAQYAKLDLGRGDLYFIMLCRCRFCIPIVPQVDTTLLCSHCLLEMSTSGMLRIENLHCVG